MKKLIFPLLFLPVLLLAQSAPPSVPVQTDSIAGSGGGGGTGPYSPSSFTQNAVLIGGGTGPITATGITSSTGGNVLTALNSVTSAAASNLTLNAGSGNQNVVLVPSGTGYVLIGSVVASTAMLNVNGSGLTNSFGNSNSGAGGHNWYFGDGAGSSGVNGSFGFFDRTSNGQALQLTTTQATFPGQLVLPSGTTNAIGLNFNSDTYLYRQGVATLALASASASASPFLTFGINGVADSTSVGEAAAASAFFLDAVSGDLCLRGNNGKSVRIGPTAVSENNSPFVVNATSASFVGSLLVGTTISLTGSGTTTLTALAAGTLGVSGSSPGAIALRYIQGAGSSTLNGNLIDLGGTANANLNLSTSSQTGDITFTTGSTPATALTLSHTNQAATFGGSIATASPSGGTAAPWNLGSYVSTPPTGTSGYAQIAIAGAAYNVPVGPASLVRATGRVTAQVAAAGSIATYTVGASDGTFLVSGNVLVTASVTNSFIETCAYTDESNTARTLTLTFSNVGGTFLTTITNVTGTGAYEGIPLHIRAKAGTTITFATVGTFTSVTYNAEGEVRQIN